METARHSSLFHFGHLSVVLASMTPGCAIVIDLHSGDVPGISVVGLAWCGAVTFASCPTHVFAGQDLLREYSRCERWGRDELATQSGAELVARI